MAIGTLRLHVPSEAINAAKLKTLSFDNIATSAGGGYADVENGYGKLSWSNMYVLNAATSGISVYGNSGYITGVTSGQQVAYTGYGEPASIYLAAGTFTFNSVQMTSAWNVKERVEITAYDGEGNVLHDKIVRINDSGPTLVTLNWKGVSTIEFTPLDGKQDPNLSGSGLHVVFDDIIVSKVRAEAPTAPSQHSVLGEGIFASTGAGHVDAPPVHHDLFQPVHMALV